jgi:hypothetical protein
MKLNIINLILMCLTETECHLLAIWKIAGAVVNLESFFAKFGLQERCAFCKYAWKVWEDNDANFFL